MDSLDRLEGSVHAFQKDQVESDKIFRILSRITYFIVILHQSIKSI